MGVKQQCAKLHGSSDVARGDGAAGDVPHLSNGKVRQRKRKYTRTASAWAARAAKRRAKLAAKYGESSSAAVTAVEGCSISASHEPKRHGVDALAAASRDATSASEAPWVRSVQADFVHRVLLASRGLADYIDVDSTVATFVRDEITKAQWLGHYDLAAAYAEGAICSVAWEHSIEYLHVVRHTDV